MNIPGGESRMNIPGGESRMNIPGGGIKNEHSRRGNQE